MRSGGRMKLWNGPRLVSQSHFGHIKGVHFFAFVCHS